MNKELYEVLNKLRKSLLNSTSATLTKKEIHLLIKYINDLEKEITGDINE